MANCTTNESAVHKVQRKIVLWRLLQIECNFSLIFANFLFCRKRIIRLHDDRRKAETLTSPVASKVGKVREKGGEREREKGREREREREWRREGERRKIFRFSLPRSSFANSKFAFLFSPPFAEETFRVTKFGKGEISPFQQSERPLNKCKWCCICPSSIPSPSLAIPSSPRHSLLLPD
jgi:hypothetical protein